MRLFAKKEAPHDEDLAQVLRQMGVAGAATSLMASRYEPAGCMAQTEKTLDFLGVGGSKWVIDRPAQTQFRSFLEKVQARDGLVRFLLINPEGAAYAQLQRLRRAVINPGSLQPFSEFMVTFPCLQVRLYDLLPSFRLIFLDHKTLALSRFKFEGQSRAGWEAPHLIVDADASWSLYHPFETVFQQIWDPAERLS